MEEILNHLISMDDACKRELRQLQEKQENIEYLVNEEISKRKDEIKTKYKFKMDMRKSEYEAKLSQTAQNIEANKLQKIETIKITYEKDKPNLISDTIKAILG